MTATSTIAATDFMVDRKDLRSSRFSAASLPAAPAPGEVLLAIDTFALTANNITYAAFGDAMQYWNFFPAADPAWGRVPVWGFADVIASACEGVAPGERIYGVACNVHIHRRHVIRNGLDLVVGLDQVVAAETLDESGVRGRGQADHLDRLAREQLERGAVPGFRRRARQDHRVRAEVAVVGKEIVDQEGRGE